MIVFKQNLLTAVTAFLLAGCQSMPAYVSDAVDAAGFTKSVRKLPANSSNISSLTEVIRNEPEDPGALNMRGTAYGQKGMYQKALADFNAAIDLDPGYYQAYANRALVHARMKNFTRAMSDYNRVIEIAPDYHIAYVGRGELYHKRKNRSLALADFSQAIELRGEDPVAYLNRGLVYQELGQHANAVSDFDIAISLRPDSSAPYMGRGISRMELLQYEDAYDDFYIAARKGENNYAAWGYRGLAAERFGDKLKAERAYKRALQIEPGFKMAQDGIERTGSSK
jgi:tetratricopeptide (TPR) repeat protein